MRGGSKTGMGGGERGERDVVIDSSDGDDGVFPHGKRRIWP